MYVDGTEQTVDQRDGGNIMSSGIADVLPSVLKARPALQDGE